MDFNLIYRLVSIKKKNYYYNLTFKLSQKKNSSLFLSSIWYDWSGFLFGVFFYPSLILIRYLMKKGGLKTAQWLFFLFG